MFAPPEGGIYEFDGAMIVARDAGPRLDAGRLDAGRLDAGRLDAGRGASPDARVAMRDAGPPDAAEPFACSPVTVGGDCTLWVPPGRFGPLTGVCLPRCRASSVPPYLACTDPSCRGDVATRDTMPPVDYSIGTLPVSPPMDCLDCIFYQDMHCVSLACPTEVDDYVEWCLARVDTARCDAAIFAIDDCRRFSPLAERERIDACNRTTEGLAGCFACE